MMNEIALGNGMDVEKVLALWADGAKLKTIKDMFAKNATQEEFETFVQMGIACRLNPFLREIWCVKYDRNAAAQIFVARDGYRKIISRNPNYDGHIVDAVFSHDEFNVDLVNGIVKHVPNFKERGRLIGAYCITYMKNSKIPHYVFAEAAEYNTGRSVWKEKPATMIKKVAESQCIRMADQTCSGTYAPEEMPDEGVGKHSPKAADLNKEYGLYDGEKVDAETGEVTEPAAAMEHQEPHIIEPDAPKFSFDEVKAMMESAANSDDLHAAASVISQVDISKEERAELTKIYRAKVKEVKNLES